MSGATGSSFSVGNDFIVPVKKARPAAVAIDYAPVAYDPYEESLPVAQSFSAEPLRKNRKPAPSFKAGRIISPVTVISLAALMIGTVGSQAAAAYFAPSIKLASVKTAAQPQITTGINVRVADSQLNDWLNAYSSQPATINLGSSTVAISPDVLKSWLQMTPNPAKTEQFVHLNTAVIGSSILSIVQKYTSSPINQVEITRPDGSSEVAVGGRNGSQLSDPSSINTQAADVSRNLFSNKGFQINAPLATVPFQSLTPSAFNKLLVADINSMKMYAYENGQLVNQFLISAGKPSTPTPIGEFHIWEKLTVQDMSGFNQNGTRYFQPHVHWVNYFTHTGVAVHGVYWHPLSWFGAHNSSHGCVGVSDSDGEWIYNWAPIGTTVITTPN